MLTTVQVVDVFGLPVLGGAITALCTWQPEAEAELITRASGRPIHLACRVTTEAGEVIVDGGSRSRPLPTGPGSHVVPVSLEVPPAAGDYDVSIDAVVEHAFWASWHGAPPCLLRARRLPGGEVIVDDGRSGRWYRLPVPSTDAGGAVSRWLPSPRYGVGASERAVEVPWALLELRRALTRGANRVLDVGHAHATPQYEAALAALGVPHLFGIDLVPRASAHLTALVTDARAPSLLPGSIDVVLAISVIEHVGRDNASYRTRYAGSDLRHAGGDVEALRALGDLLAPGGHVLLTVPYGQAEDHGWFVQYDRDSLNSLVRASNLVVRGAAYFTYADGWHGPLPEQALADCRYGQGAVAATGVACLRLETRVGAG